MKPLRFIAASFAAVVCALGLSVGAAMAEGTHTPAKPAKSTHSAPKALCYLHDVPR
jgi:invasion protein IalB